jgi:hypothetical protein
VVDDAGVSPCQPYRRASPDHPLIPARIPGMADQNSGKITNNAYNMEVGKINILTKSKGLIDIADASDNLNLSALSKTVEKYFICYPK